MATWNPNAQCPERGPALTHITDRRKRADGGCIYCGYGATEMFGVCKGYGCVAQTKGEFCQNCIELRAQHAVSHKLEGHPQSIPMCPPCEEN